MNITGEESGVQKGLVPGPQLTSCCVVELGLK